MQQGRPLIVGRFLEPAAVPWQAQGNQFNVIGEAFRPVAKMLRIASYVRKADQASSDRLPRVDHHQPFVFFSVHSASPCLVQGVITVEPGPSAHTP